MGAALSKLHGSTKPGMPPFVGLAPNCGHKQWGDPGTAGFLGPAHSPFTPNKDGNAREDMSLKGMTIDRLGNRKSLLDSFDTLRRDVDTTRAIEGLDAFNQQAMAMLTSSQLAVALDLEKEDPKLRDRYGRGSKKKQSDGSHKLLDDFLMARRLVEAGVRCVTIAFSRWDWHGGNFKRARQDMPMLDQALTALVEDLHTRGMDKDVSVVVWGEFGRTPKVNGNKGGRDHWTRVMGALMAGGGMRNGQMIGATDRLGGEATSRPVHIQEIIATLYHNVGIGVGSPLLSDLNGRPQFLTDSGRGPIKELI